MTELKPIETRQRLPFSLLVCLGSTEHFYILHTRHSSSRNGSGEWMSVAESYSVRTNSI